VRITTKYSLPSRVEKAITVFLFVPKAEKKKLLLIILSPDRQVGSYEVALMECYNFIVLTALKCNIFFQQR
jgi:hypothetical protein